MTVGFQKDSETIKKRKKPVDPVRVIQHVLKNVLPGEAGVALRIVLEKKGLAFTEETRLRQNPFGPPTEIPFQRHQVTIDGAEMMIPWGTYHIEKVGRLSVDLQTHHAPPLPFLALQVDDNSDLAMFEEITKAVKEEAKKLTLFRGRALKVENPEDLLIPRFIDTSKSVETIFNPEIDEALEVALYAPIEHREMFHQEGIRLRRGLILEGPYGVGKTLTAYKAAQRAIANGWTFILSNNRIAAIAIETARALEPSVLFMEDMDASTTGDRDDLDDLLNLMSGVDSKKDMDTIVILSTNFIDRIDPGFLRPERIDSIIEMRPPKGDTVKRMLVSLMGDHSTDPNWHDLVQEADGCSPAILAEAVTRAKIRKLTGKSDMSVASVRRMLRQLGRQRELAQPKFVSETTEQKLATSLRQIVRGPF